jgi:histone H3/H4
MIAKAKAAATASAQICPVFIDPRTGLHMGVYYDEDDEDVDLVRPLPELDAISRERQQARRRMAEAALSPAEVVMMKSEGYCILEKDHAARNEGWSPETLYSIHVRRLKEARREQNLTDYIFPPLAFERFVREIGRNYKADIEYSQEALESMQAYFEAYLIDLAREGSHCSNQANRAILLPQDIRLVCKIRHEPRP